jgi:hypothetical protein
MEQKNLDNKISGNLKDYLEKKEEGGFEKENWLDKGRKNKKTVFIVSFLVLCLVAVVAYFALISGHKSFAIEKVEISIQLPEKLESGDEVSILFEYKNSNEVALSGASAEIFFPEDFIFKSSDKNLQGEGSRFSVELGDIAPGTSAQVRVFGKVIGNLAEKKIFSSSLQYKPANFNSKFKNTKESSVIISEVPVILEMKVPDTIKNNSEVELLFSYKNKSDRNFSKAELRIILPEGFNSYSANQNFARSSEFENILIFQKDNLIAGAENSVTLKGIMNSESSLVSLRVEIYLLEENNDLVRYINEEKDINLEKPDILISQKVNDSEEYFASKDEQLNYRITFKNQSDKEIKGMVLNVELLGNFDLTTLKAEKGNVKDGKIIWSALNVPQLGILYPGEEGSVDFIVKVNDYFLIKSKEDKNFVLASKADINVLGAVSPGSNDMELLSSELKEIKVKSFTPVVSKGYFNDDGRIENSGALPPRVGERTSYTIHWNIKNLFNDVEKVRVKTILPSGVELTGKYINSKGDVFEDGIAKLAEGEAENFDNQLEEKIYYNPKIRELTWFIPRLKANEGILTAAEEIIFQVEIIPREENVGKAMDLIGPVSIISYDTFIEGEVKTDGNALNTQLFDDYSISSEEAMVVSN